MTEVACPGCATYQPVTKEGRIRKHGRPVPCAASGQPIGTARIPRRSAAGFYKDPVTEELLRSVTTILNQGSPKEALIHWAGNLVAETALEYLPALVAASRTPARRQDAYDWLRRAHTRKKDERADIGSAVHALIEARILGQPVPADLAANSEMAPYVRHFEAFVADWQVEFTASEMVVANYAEQYAGTLDYRVTSPLLAAQLGCPPDVEIMGDTKTGGELDERTYDGDVKGIYPTVGVQMAAYRAAEYGWLRDGTKVALEPAHDVGIALHLRPEGYRVYPARCGDDAFDAFKAIRAVAEFMTGPSKGVIGTALTPKSARKAA